MKRQTNIEFITDLMDFSQSGALMQAFVMTAIQNYAAHIKENPIEDSGFISSAAWERCADEVLTKLEEHYKG